MHVEKLGEELKGNLSQSLSQILLCWVPEFKRIWPAKSLKRQKLK